MKGGCAWLGGEVLGILVERYSWLIVKGAWYRCLVRGVTMVLWRCSFVVG